MSTEVLMSSNTLPATSATITLRIIKSFEYRVQKSIVLRDVDLDTFTVGALKEHGRSVVHTQPGWKPYRTVMLDTLKIYTKAHGAKTSNLIINLDHEELVLDNNDARLAAVGFDMIYTENETEVSFFNGDAYKKFKENPEIKWE